MTDLHQMTLDEIRRARRNDPETSKAAAARSHGLAAAHRHKILVVLADGVARTADEIAEQCELDSVKVSRRLGEMRDAGLIVTTGETKPTPSGRAAMCWRRA